MNVFIATPSYSHSVCVEYTVSLAQTMDVLYQNEIGIGLSILPGDCFVGNARNRLVSEFLESPCDNIFFLDDDISWHPNNFLNILKAPFDIVAGIYPQKIDSDPIRFPVELSCDENNLITQEHEGLTFYKANSLPSGFMRIKRHVLEKMADQFKDEWYKWPEPDGSFKHHIPYFESGVCRSEHDFHGEDYNFCQKARSLGYELWTLPDLDFSHIGKKKYSGNLQLLINKLIDGEKDVNKT